MVSVSLSDKNILHTFTSSDCLTSDVAKYLDYSSLNDVVKEV